MELTYRIAEIMGVSEDKVDLVFLAEAPPLLQYQVIKEGKLLYFKDEDYRAIHEAQIVSSMVGFRNILVHAYIKIDKKLVYDVMQNKITDFKEFTKYISKPI